MGYDEPNGAVAARNVLRNFLMADYLLSSGDFMTQQMYEPAYRLQQRLPGLVLEEGNPRTDRQVLARRQRARVRGRLRAGGLRRRRRDGRALRPDLAGRVVLHARSTTPTCWASACGSSRSASRRPPVLLKVHQQVYEFAQAQPELRAVLVPNEIATNEVLGVTDVLVTDYSSIFFDFLATGRPVVFFTPDLDEYAGYRGFYLDRDELPGPGASTEAGCG